MYDIWSFTSRSCIFWSCIFSALFARCFLGGETKFADFFSDVVNPAQFWSSCGSRVVQSGIEGLVW